MMSRGLLKQLTELFQKYQSEGEEGNSSSSLTMNIIRASGVMQLLADLGAKCTSTVI